MNNENYNVEDEGVSLSQILGWIKRRWIVFVGLMVAITLFIGVGFQLVFMPNDKTYNIRFSYEYVNNLNDGYYLDGTKFQYRDLISFNSLEQAKNTSADYKDLNVKGIFEHDKLEILEERFYANPKDATTELLGVEYQISVPARYFESKEQAKEYLIALVNIPVEYNLNYLKELELFDFNSIATASTYTDQLAFINKYIDSIRQGYNKLIEDYGNVYAYVNTDEFGFKSDLLANLLRDFEFNLNKTNYKYLNTEYETYKYIKNYTTDETVRIKIKNYISILEYQLQNKQETLDKLQGQLKDLQTNGNGSDFGQSISGLVTKITELQLEITNLEQELKKYNDLTKSYEKDPTYQGKDYLNATIKFDENLNEVVDALKDEAVKFQYVYKNVNARDAQVVYMNNSVIKTESTSLLIVLAVGLVLGLVVGATVAGALGYNDEKRSKKEEELIK